jgi:hypothetical protein
MHVKLPILFMIDCRQMTCEPGFTKMMELLSITVTKDDEIVAEDLNCRSAEYSSGDDMEN